MIGTYNYLHYVWNSRMNSRKVRFVNTCISTECTSLIHFHVNICEERGRFTETNPGFSSLKCMEDLIIVFILSTYSRSCKR